MPPKRPTFPLPPKAIPTKGNRGIDVGDILLIRDATLDGKRLGTHYFLVLEHYVPYDEDDPGLNRERCQYTTDCLLMGSYDDEKKKRDANITFPKEHTVWYSNAKMPDEHKEKDSIVRTDTRMYFDLRDTTYEHCGEILSKYSFSESEIDKSIPDNQKKSYLTHLKKTNNIHQSQILGTMEENDDHRTLSRTMENTPDFKQREATRKKALTEATNKQKPSARNTNTDFADDAVSKLLANSNNVILTQDEALLTEQNKFDKNKPASNPNSNFG